MKNPQIDTLMNLIDEKTKGWDEREFDDLTCLVEASLQAAEMMADKKLNDLGIPLVYALTSILWPDVVERADNLLATEIVPIALGV